MFVLNRIRAPAAIKFNNVRFADQTKLIIPNRQRPLNAKSGTRLKPRRVHGLVNRLTTQRVYVLRERLLLMNQRALARAIHPVLQGRKGNGLKLGDHCRSPTFDLFEQFFLQFITGHPVSIRN